MEPKEFIIFLLDSLKILLIALAIVIPIRMLLFQPFIVKGNSMEPNYHSTDYLIIDEVSYRFREPQRGEVIVFKYPKDVSQRYIKRIVGLPNETVEIVDGQLYIAKEGSSREKIDESLYITDKVRAEWKNNLSSGPLKLGENEYFVMGDNRNFSSDSRKWGVVPKNNIIGRILLRISPFEVLVNTINSESL
ncbi:MAG: signal peptidase I [Candidatus Pacebacteria bacterium]|nr:signal peptidase I [Candidatus Paceibacterota bacterium]